MNLQQAIKTVVSGTPVYTKIDGCRYKIRSIGFGEWIVERWSVPHNYYIQACVYTHNIGAANWTPEEPQ